MSTINVQVVSMILGKSLLNNGHPEGACITSGLAFTEASTKGIAFFREWKVVVDDDGVGHPKGVEVDSIDAVGADLILAVQEHLFDSAWDLRHSSTGGE